MNTITPRQTDTKRLFQTGRALAKLRRFKDAEKILNRVLISDSSYLPAYDLLAYVLEAQDRFKEAESILGHLKIARTMLAHDSKGMHDKTFNKNDFRHPFDPEQELNELLSELDKLIGLKKVKHQIHQLIRLANIQHLRRQRGLSETPVVLHNVFVGNPGTGKTTIARLYGRLLKCIGMLSKGHLIETDRSGLVAEYIGHTELKTNRIVDEAIGGVLFIDEAYSLFKGDGSGRDFGAEAIQVLLKRMEDNRKDLAIIVAGYPQPMKDFIKSNEGLSSRFPTTIEFEDYNPDELMQMYQVLCKDRDYQLTKEATQKVFDLISNKHSTRNKNFGNARFVRNLFESTVKNQAFRLGESNGRFIPNAELIEILPEDIQSEGIM